MSIKIDDTNYETYKKVGEIIFNNLWSMAISAPIPELFDPMFVLNAYESKSKSLAKRAFKESLNDHLAHLRSHLRYMPQETVAKISAELKSNNLPSLSELLGSTDKMIDAVFKAGKIKNMHQYYLIKELLSDVDIEMPDEQQQQLFAYLSAFESRKTKKGEL